MNVTCLGKGAFADVTSFGILRSDHPGLFGGALNPVTRVITGDKRGETDTLRRGHVVTEQRLEGAATSPGAPGATRSWQRLAPRPFGGNGAP